jgi:hypothetical protein
MMIELKDTDCIDAPVEASVGFAFRASSDSNIGCQPLNAQPFSPTADNIMAFFGPDVDRRIARERAEKQQVLCVDTSDR